MIRLISSKIGILGKIIITTISKFQIENWSRKFEFPEIIKFVHSFAPNISWWKGIHRGSYGTESSEVCRKVFLDLKMYRFPYEKFELDIFRNNDHEKYENQNVNFQDDRFRWNFFRASINSFQAHLVQWWSKSDRQIFHTYEMKIFDNFIFKIKIMTYSSLSFFEKSIAWILMKRL